MPFTTKFITYQGLYRTIQTEKLNLPTEEGRRTILPNHMPIMLPIKVGVIETLENNVLIHYAITEGMLMFENNEATILADSIFTIEDINIEKAEHSLKKAQEKLAASSKEADIMRAKIALARATNLIEVKNKYKK